MRGNHGSRAFGSATWRGKHQTGHSGNEQFNWHRFPREYDQGTLAGTR